MKLIVGLCVLVLVLAGCKAKVVYVPIESVKTEYRDRLKHDSIYVHDSTFVRLAGDTVFFERYKYLYQNKIVRDSIFKTDSVQVPYPVMEYKEVNKLSSWQHFQVWCGRILLVLAIGYLLWKYKQ